MADPQSEAEKHIRRIIAADGGDFRKLSLNALERIAKMTWSCYATYEDVSVIGGAMLVERVWRQENIMSKYWMREEYNRTGTVDLSWRKGAEMAVKNKHMVVKQRE